MKRFAALLALLLFASAAHAAGVSLRWNTCEGASNRTFACDRSSGQELLVGGFSPPGGINQFVGIEAILSIAAADGNAPSWWQMFEAGNCRRGSMAASFDMTDQTDCEDAWSGLPTVGSMVAADAPRVDQYNLANPNGVDVCLSAALAQSGIHGISSGRTYAAFKLTINHQKSGGAGACGGCDTPVCITLDAIRLVQVSRPGPATSDGDNKKAAVYVDLTDGIGGMDGQSQVATWQGGTANCGAGLSKPSTWAELKSRFKTK